MFQLLLFFLFNGQRRLYKVKDWALSKYDFGGLKEWMMSVTEWMMSTGYTYWEKDNTWNWLYLWLT